MEEKEYTYWHYFEDLIPLLVDNAKSHSRNKSRDDFEKGVCIGYRFIFETIVTVAKNQGVNFSITEYEQFDILTFRKKFGEHTEHDLPKYKKCLIDVIAILLQEHESNKETNLLNSGKKHSIYDTLSLMQQQAVLAFELDLEEIGLKKDVDLLLFA